MNLDLLIVAVLAGAANWALRVLPTRMRRTALLETGPMARFLAATGPAAIATLFAAAILPMLSPLPRDLIPVIVGTGVVLAVFLRFRGVVAATLAGSVACGLSVLGIG